MSINNFFICVTLISTFCFSSCYTLDEGIAEVLTIQEKITLLESGEWLLKGFEDRVMHTFKNGECFTFYGSDHVFSDAAIPGTESYTAHSSRLSIDSNAGNVKIYDVTFSCSNNIVEFFHEGTLNMTLYKRYSNYLDCLT